MYSEGFKLTTPNFRSRCSHHCAMEDLQICNTIFVFIDNRLNAVKTVSRQSELLSCLPINTVNTQTERVPIVPCQKGVETVRTS